MANFFYTDAKGQKHLLTPLESDNGSKGLAGQIRGLLASTEPQTEPQSLDCEKRNTQSKDCGSVNTRTPRRQIPTTIGIAIILLVTGVGITWDRLLAREPATASRNITTPQEESQPAQDRQAHAVPLVPSNEVPALRRTPEPIIPLPHVAARPMIPPAVERMERAELPPGWTQEQYQTLMKFRGEVRNPNAFTQRERDVLINGDIKNIDPILIGRNILFGPDWLEFVGNRRPLSRQQFQAWRDRLDRVYDAYEDLSGTKPIWADNIFITLRPAREFLTPRVGGEVSWGSSIVRINNDILSDRENNFGRLFFEDIRSNGITLLVPHEMAHVFARGRVWEIEPEAAAEFLVAYALESLHFHYGRPGFSRASNRFGSGAPTRGAQHREVGFAMANKARLNNTITPIAAMPSHMDSVHAFYKFGLASVDGVGWDAFKLAFRSYENPNFVPRYTYGSRNRQHAQARDLFDRVAQFSEIARRTNNPDDALRTLPDRGQLLDRHLPVTKTPNTVTQGVFNARRASVMQGQLRAQEMREQQQRQQQQIQPTQRP